MVCYELACVKLTPPDISEQGVRSLVGVAGFNEGGTKLILYDTIWDETTPQMKPASVFTKGYIIPPLRFHTDLFSTGFSHTGKVTLI